jgi:hypothetical protein
MMSVTAPAGAGSAATNCTAQNSSANLNTDARIAPDPPARCEPLNIRPPCIPDSAMQPRLQIPPGATEGRCGAGISYLCRVEPFSSPNDSLKGE